MSIQKITSLKLVDNMKSLEQYLQLNRIITFDSVLPKFETMSHIPMPVFRYPSLLYGSALSTGSNASDVKASEQLDQAQEVSADPKQLLQIWS